jgi:hypothetical protein
MVRNLDQGKAPYCVYVLQDRLMLGGDVERSRKFNICIKNSVRKGECRCKWRYAAREEKGEEQLQGEGKGHVAATPVWPFGKNIYPYIYSDIYTHRERKSTSECKG